MALTPPERETVVTVSDDDEYVEIWTAQRTQITKLRKESLVSEIRHGFDDSTEWAEFRIPADRWSVSSGIRRTRKPMTDAQRQAATERLRKRP